MQNENIPLGTGLTNQKNSIEPYNDVKLLGAGNSPQWAFQVIPLPGESLTSWILREIRANMVNPTTIIREELGIELSDIDVDVDEVPTIIRYFSKRTGLPEAEILKLKPEVKIPSELKETEKDFYNIFIKTNKGTLDSNRSGPRFCPTCLAHDNHPYLRRIWRLGFVNACSIHHCLLENKCPKCNTVIRPYLIPWSQPLTQCHNCGFNLSEIIPITISAQDEHLQAQESIIEHSDLDLDKQKRLFQVIRYLFQFCSPTDSVLKNHPLTQNKSFNDIWTSAKRGSAKRAALQQPSIMYLLLGVAYSLLQDPTQFEEFLSSHYSSTERFWTETPFICHYCNTTFSEFKTLEGHLRTHTREKPFKCEHCGKEFSFHTGLQNHLRTHTGEKPYRCEHCGKTFSRLHVMENHVRYKHTGEKPYHCSQCERTFTDNKSLTMHVRRAHTGEKPYQCPHCEKAFVEKGDLNSHLRVHTGEKPYKCEVCNKSFRTSNTFNKHQMIHTGERPFKCPQCEQSFIRKQNLTVHLRNHTGERPFRCTVCGFTFTRKESLITHERTHLDVKPFPCTYCEMTFASKAHLTMHLRTHTGEKPYKCDVCGQTFAKKEYVVKHLRTHTGEKPYTCDQCGKRFTTKPSLDNHIQCQHITKRNYSCIHCQKGFTTEEKLTRHVRTHTGELPFHCQHCGKGFAVESNFNDHLQIHTQPEIWANRLAPLPGESLSSWILRVARVNQMNLESILRTNLNIQMSSANPESDHSPEIIQYFAQHTGYPESAIAALIARPPIRFEPQLQGKGKNSPLNNVLWKVGNPVNSKVTHGPRYCPLCLKSDAEPYFRQDWQLGVIGACVKHTCILENKCPKCGSPLLQWKVKWDKPISLCHKCGYDLRETKPINIDPADPNLQALQNLLSSEDPVDLSRLFAIMWFLVQNCSISDTVFKEHLITKVDRFLTLWKDVPRKGSTRQKVLAEPSLIFLVFGTAYSLLHDKIAFARFLEEHHSSETHFWTAKPFLCKYCGLNVEGLQHITEHLRTHTGNKPHQCTYCNAAFAHKSSLVQHLRMHTGEKPYLCEVCGAIFARGGSLKDHLRTHTGEKTYKCEFCGAAFARIERLKIHKRQHTGERPFLCQYCGKKFNEKQTLTFHLRTHTGEKPFVCEICQQAFAQKANLTRHLRTHTKKQLTFK